MPDHFALLNEPRRPWLDVEELKQKFHALTATQHPDVNASGDFAAINHAYQILSDPVKRLRHFLELNAVAALASSTPVVPAQLAELFMRVGTARQTADAFLKKQAQATTPLAQALLASEKFAVLDQLENVRAVLEQQREPLFEELKNSGSHPDVRRLAEILAELSYLSKWSEQLREGLLKLSL
jgi:curved DNA-binding protein CbpA